MGRIQAQVGVLDAPVNSAGISPFAVEDQPGGRGRALQTNLIGPLRTDQVVYPDTPSPAWGDRRSCFGQRVHRHPFLVDSASKFALRP